MKRIIITLLIACILIAIYWRALFNSNHADMPSALVGASVPAFTLTDLNNSFEKFTSSDLATGKVVLLNVWATWCYACEAEADMLMKIKDVYHVTIYGIAYKDKANDVKAWLKKFGNPYKKIGDDINGDTAIDLGVYGTPETFVISPQGKIIYRHVGAIDQRIWDEVIYPLVQTNYPFSSQTETQRFTSLINEIRCPVCQGQSIAESNAPLANDLRNKVYQLIQENQTDTEIRQYLTQRYGDVILLRPPLKKSTWVLWGFPFLLLAFIPLFLFIKKRKHKSRL